IIKGFHRGRNMIQSDQRGPHISTKGVGLCAPVHGSWPRGITVKMVFRCLMVGDYLSEGVRHKGEMVIHLGSEAKCVKVEFRSHSKGLVPPPAWHNLATWWVPLTL